MKVISKMEIAFVVYLKILQLNFNLWVMFIVLEYCGNINIVKFLRLRVKELWFKEELWFFS